MEQVIKRKRELDFLRGMAIILVLFRHQPLTQVTANMGWIGVDLFFVLSGFLVSGLLFKEYLRFDDVKPGLFLIRRGFKIYPLFYLILIPYVVLLYSWGQFSWGGLLSELFFFQNYYSGWGWAFGSVSWSLAVEEHFYFGFTILFSLLVSKGYLNLRKQATSKYIGWFEISILLIMFACLIARVLSNYYLNIGSKNFTMTHLRIDSLLAGVLVAYLYYVRPDFLKAQFNRWKYLLAAVAVVCVSFTPFVNPNTSFYVKTIGFPMLFFAFSVLLLYFLLTPGINNKLDKFPGKYVADFVSHVGLYSYSIYLLHILMQTLWMTYTPTKNIYVNFVAYFFLSILSGKLISETVEKYFLKLRDKFYPSRVEKVV